MPVYLRERMPTIHLQARRKGGAWGTRSKMETENKRMLLPPTDRQYMTVEQVKAAGRAKANGWTDMVKDPDVEFRVVEV